MPEASDKLVDFDFELLQYFSRLNLDHKIITESKKTVEV